MRLTLTQHIRVLFRRRLVYVMGELENDDWFTESSSHPFQMSHFELLWLNWFHSEEAFDREKNSSDYGPNTCFSIFEENITFWFIILSHSLSSPKKMRLKCVYFLFNATRAQEKSLSWLWRIMEWFFYLF
jgi:hypothetical protein